MEQGAFESLAMAELESVFRFARFLTRSSVEAEELVQDVYARAFRAESVAGFEPRRAGNDDASGMRSWLLTIARSIFYNRLENQRVGQRAIEQATTAAAQRGLEAPAADEVERVEWTRARPALMQAVESLSVELREVLWLWAVEGMKYREIAEAMGVPMGTVMSRLHRARTQAAAAVLRSAAGAPALAERLGPSPRRSVDPGGTHARGSGGSRRVKRP